MRSTFNPSNHAKVSSGYTMDGSREKTTAAAALADKVEFVEVAACDAVAANATQDS
jgi:hypothetical protein